MTLADWLKAASSVAVLVALSACAQQTDAGMSADVSVSPLSAAGLVTQTRDPRAAPPGPVDAPPISSVSTFSGDSALAPPMPIVKFVPGGKVSIDLEDADITAAAKAVLGDALKATYTIDPKVQGKVTMKTGRPLAADKALKLFESALAANGVALVRSHDVYRILPQVDAPAASPNGIETAGDRVESAGFAVRAVPLKYVSAAEMAEILKPIAKDAVVRVDKDRNALVLQGGSAQFEAAMDTIHTFDVDWLANKSVGVFRLANTTAAAVTKALTTLLQNENIDASMAKAIPLDGSETVIVVAKTPDILWSVRGWVARLDRTGGSPLRMFTYEMRYARAASAGPIAGSALGITAVVAGQTGSGGRSGDASKTGTDTKTGATGRNGGGGTGGSTMSGTGTGTGTASAPTPDPARAVLDQGQKPSDSAGGDTGEGAATARIVIDESSNKLLVYGTAEMFEKVKAVMRTIDVPQRQVLVEATFLEVDLNDDLQYGVQYFLDKIVNHTTLKGSLTGNDSGQPGYSGPGGALSIGMNAQAILSTLSGVTKVNVISSPNLLVTNNQPARLVVGDQVPVTTQSQNTLVNTAVTVTSVEYRDTGIIFDVTPHVTASGAVALDILQEVSSVKNTASTLTPTISQRRVTSSVVAGNNETIVIGGLFSDQHNDQVLGLPGVVNTPMIGGLFGSTSNNHTKTELLVLISPKIVNNRDDARNITRELAGRISDLRLAERTPAARCRPPACVSSKF